jgi:hypothetical protein
MMESTFQFPPPPRIVRRGFSVGRTFGWVFLLTFLLGTVGAGLALLNELAYRFLGHDVSAAVTSLHEHPDGDGGYKRIAHYTYTPGPGHAARMESARIDHRVFRELQKPFMIDTIPDDVTFPADRPGVLAVRVYTLGPIVYGRPVEHEHGLLFWLIPVLVLIVSIPTTYLAYQGLIVRGRKRRWLTENGVAVAGTITARRQEANEDAMVWLADYEFRPEGAKKLAGGSIWLRSEKAYEHAQPGARVTVIYDPGDVGRSTVYEYGEFRVG